MAWIFIIWLLSTTFLTMLAIWQGNIKTVRLQDASIISAVWLVIGSVTAICLYVFYLLFSTLTYV